MRSWFWYVVVAIVAIATMAGPLPHGTARGAGTSASTPSSSTVPAARAIATSAVPDLTGGANTLDTYVPVERLLYDAPLGTFVSISIPPPLGSSYVNGTLRAVSDANFAFVALLSFNGTESPRIAIDTTNGSVFFTNVSGELSLLSGSTFATLATVAVPAKVLDVAYDPVDGDAYVLTGCQPGLRNFNATVTIVNATRGTVAGSVPMTCDPNGLAVDTTSGNVFVLDGTGGNLSVISGTNFTVVATVPGVAPPSLPGLPPPAFLTFDARDGLLYVRCTSGTSAPGCIDVFGSSGALVAHRLLGPSLDGGFAVDGAGDIDFLGWSNTTGISNQYLFSLAPPNGTITSAVELPCGSDQLAWNPVNRELFATAHCGTVGQDGAITMITIAPFAVVTTFTVVNATYVKYPKTGDLTALDPVTGDMALGFPIASGGSGLSIVGPFRASFHASIYAPGVNWTVTITFASGYRTAFATEDSSVTVWLPNGSYTFSYSVPNGYAQSPAGGAFTMRGAAVDESVDISWAWWFWTGLALGGVVLGWGVLLARKARREFHKRRGSASARLRFDLAHPLYPEGGPGSENERPRL